VHFGLDSAASHASLVLQPEATVPKFLLNHGFYYLIIGNNSLFADLEPRL
jgi:hypothetical protein